MSEQDEAVAWLRSEIEARLAKARVAAPGPWHWVQEGCGDKMTLVSGHWRGHERGGWREVIPVKGIGPDVVDAEHIEANDPQDVIADCEAKLAILAEHAPTDWTADGDRMCSRCRWDEDEPEREEGNDTIWVIFPCRTVRLLASAYRHREGYAQHWGGAVEAGVAAIKPG